MHIKFYNDLINDGKKKSQASEVQYRHDWGKKQKWMDIMDVDVIDYIQYKQNILHLYLKRSLHSASKHNATDFFIFSIKRKLTS